MIDFIRNYPEAFLAITIVAFCLMITVFILYSCIIVHKVLKVESQAEKSQGRTIELTSKEFQDVIKQVNEAYTDPNNSDEDFINLVQKVCNGEPTGTPPLCDSQTIEITEIVDLDKDGKPIKTTKLPLPCEGHNCPSSPSREDCCNCDLGDGKCHLIININKLCGIEGIVQNPELLTPQEVQMLSDALAEFDKNAEKNR